MKEKIRKKSANFLGSSPSLRIAIISFFEILIGIFAVAASLAIFLKLADGVINKVTFSFDTAIANFFFILRSPVLTSGFKIISFLGGQTFLTTASIVAIIFLLKKHRKDAFVFSFILIFGLGLNFFLKNLFHRPRPQIMPLVQENSYSFPSGHAMNSFVFYLSLAYFVFRDIKDKKLRNFLFVLLAILVAGIGISRIYLGVHYPSDVIAGYLAGAGWFIIVLLFEKRKFFRSNKNSMAKIRLFAGLADEKSGSNNSGG